MPSKARSEELHAAAMRLVTPDVVQELDALLESGGEENQEERRVRLRALADTLAHQTGCALATARQHVAKAIRLRRGEAVKADGRGGYRPGAGAPAGNQNWRGKVALTDGGRDDPSA